MGCLPRYQKFRSLESAINDLQNLIGQDNTSDLCTTGDVGNIFEGSESDHDGPYDGVTMGC